MYLLILGAIVYVLSRISKNGFGKPSGLSLLIYLAIGGLGLAFLIAMIEGDSHSSKRDTDGVYESATKKMDEAEDTMPPVTLTLSSEVNVDGMIRIVLKTNLPDDTIVMVTLGNQRIGYTAQDKITVSDGTCETGFFDNGGSALQAGTYQVNITMPVAQVQPEDVQAVIGKQGEHLTGPYVKEDVDSRIVQFSQDIQIQ